jgi:glycosyltransferase involved in cell wall biosynthesis
MGAVLKWMSPKVPKLVSSSGQASNVTTVRKSVLFVGAFPGPAALDRYVSGDLALRLQSLGWRTRVTSRRLGRLTRLWDIMIETWRARGEYEVACIDVFSGPSFFWAEAAAWLLRRLNKPYVLTLHGGNLPEFAARWPGRVRRLLASAKIVTAPSGYLKQRMAHCCPEIRVIPNPIDISLYPYRERSPAQPKLIWLRAFHEMYNPVMAVKVVAALTSKHPDIHLTMVGSDKGDGSLQRTKAEVAKTGLAEKVQFSGPVQKTEVPRVLSEADVFLNTTNVDNTPVSVIEAMACGLCVITTRVGGTPFLVNDERDGLLVECDNVQDMADGVARLLEDEHLARRLSQAARQRANDLNWPRMLADWDRLLSTVQN